MIKLCHRRLGKWLAFFLVVFGFLLGPVLTAQQANVATLTAISEKQGTKSQPAGPSVYDLLIIAPKQFIQALRPLVAHKDHMGIRTRLVCLPMVYMQMYWHGRDKPEKIKYFIKTAKELWGITYVMLVGDYQLMPVRYVYNADNNTEWAEPRFVSELYYADLYDKNGNFSSWDTNGNGIYGEWYGDVATDPNIDLYPDVYVGRLACMNVGEVRTMVHKIITYETTAYNQEWFKRFVVCAGDTYPESLNPNWTGNEGEVNTQDAIDNMSGFTPVKLWTSDGSFTGPKDIIQAIDKGCGFLYFSGHANAYNWGTHPPNDPNTWIHGLSTINMNQLKNRQMLPICVVGGCHNNEFDVSPKNILKGIREEGFFPYFSKNGSLPDLFYRYTWIRECWGWKLTRISRGGSIATIGNTGLGMSKEDKQSFTGAGDYLEPTFFREYGVNGTHILGRVWGNAITDYLKKYPIDWNTPAAKDCAIDAKTVQQWALFGDPSLMIGGYGPS